MLRTLHIGGGVEQIGENAFFGCRMLTVLTLERGLDRIGEAAFAGCEGLTQVTMPWGTGSVGRMAFFGCSNYPDCTFMSWDMPTGELCPKCGKYLVTSKDGKSVRCSSRDCSYTVKNSNKGKK